MRIGRFAPSPTGPLHLGSLLTAVASYCDMHAMGGQWRVRIEDIDPLREQPGASDQILRTLDHFGLHPEGEVVFQHRRLDAYHAVIDNLLASGHAYWCTCSRRQWQGRYPGTCRGRTRKPTVPAAVRIVVPDDMHLVHDELQGKQVFNLHATTGDFVILRKEGFVAYHLAVVVDDAWQGVTDIMRGIDLLDSTPAHQVLQSLLDLPTPRYAHLPVIVNAEGQKLSKQTFAPALDNAQPGGPLLSVLTLLGQQPPEALRRASPTEILAWATAHWKRSAIPARAALHLG